MTNQKSDGHVWQLAIKIKETNSNSWLHCLGTYNYLTSIVNKWSKYRNASYNFFKDNRCMTPDLQDEHFITIQSEDDDICRESVELTLCMGDIEAMSVRHLYGPDKDGNRWWMFTGTMDCGIEMSYKFEHESEAEALVNAWVKWKASGTDMDCLHEFECVSDTYDRSVMRRVVNLERIVTACVTNTN